MKNIIILIFISALATVSCSKQNGSDAYGNFEAVETIISAEANGKLLSFTIEEGEKYTKGNPVGLIDTLDLYLQKQQLIAQKAAARSKITNISSQIDIYTEQQMTLLKDQKRIRELFKTGTATQKQLDDINGKINVSEKQIASVKTQNETILNEIESIEWGIRLMNDKISKCHLRNPVKGIVLDKYVRENEFVTIGKPLYKIADTDELELRVYISGAQLSQVKIGEKVKVLFDKDADQIHHAEGIVSWISNQAEFTPKIIQTKEERVKLVYAMKVRVKNDERIKIGMPGEVIFN